MTLRACDWFTPEIQELAAIAQQAYSDNTGRTPLEQFGCVAAAVYRAANENSVPDEIRKLRQVLIDSINCLPGAFASAGSSTDFLAALTEELRGYVERQHLSMERYGRHLDGCHCKNYPHSYSQNKMKYCTCGLAAARGIKTRTERIQAKMEEKGFGKQRELNIDTASVATLKPVSVSDEISGVQTALRAAADLIGTQAMELAVLHTNGLPILIEMLQKSVAEIAALKLKVKRLGEESDEHAALKVKYEQLTDWYKIVFERDEVKQRSIDKIERICMDSFKVSEAGSPLYYFRQTIQTALPCKEPRVAPRPRAVKAKSLADLDSYMPKGEDPERP